MHAIQRQEDTMLPDPLIHTLRLVPDQLEPDVAGDALKLQGALRDVLGICVAEGDAVKVVQAMARPGR